MLSIRSFTKSYHRETILSIDLLDLDAGIHFVKGENGSGKTTLFKCLAGIAPCQGEISTGDIHLRKDPVAYKYRINFAEAEPLYPGYLMANDLMHFVGKTKRASDDQIRFYRQHLDMDWFFNKSCSTYSSGMLKKLSLALAFLGEPKAIILDEPFITLDEKSRNKLFEIITKKKETIFLLSSHQTIEASALPISHDYRIENRTLVTEKSY